MAAGPWRIGQTKERAPPLLRTVRGKPHARDEHHEHVQQKNDTPRQRLPPQERGEAELTRDPASPDHEQLRAPPTSTKSPLQPLESLKPLNSRPANDHLLRKPPGSSRKRKAETPLPPSTRGREPEPEPGLRKPGAKKTRNAAPRVPRPGHFEQSRAAKEGLERGKEDAAAENTPPASSQDIWGFDPLTLPSHGSQKGKKKTFGAGKKTSNIHAAAPVARPSRTPPKAGSNLNKKSVESESEDDDQDNVSMLSEPLNEEWLANLGALADMSKPGPEDPELRKVPQKKKNAAHTNGDAPEPSAMDEAGLAEALKPTLREQLGLTHTQASSIPLSSAPQEDMDQIDSYVRELPAEAEEDTACPICKEPVDQQSYWHFWKGRDKTVKNQATFCHTHRKATAQDEYAAEGYPTIDWSKLSERIKKHRMALYNILTGETSSHYRTRYEPLALTGKAAAVPSKRSDLCPSKQEELASYALDDNAVYPGYYGPRGRRLVIESVMSMLNTEIKRSTDPVVQTSGPATFVQAVLVPEVAVRLIMEDMTCDRDEAEEVRERTFEMGILLNEEIEDEVIVAEEGEEEEEEETENEYLC